MLSEFRGFLTKTNAMALAIGVIIGAAVGKVVSSLADDILMPLISILLPAGNWRQARILISTSTDATGKVTENAILYGHFIGTLIDFILIALVVYLVTKSLIKAPPAANMKQCTQCMETVPAEAHRCRACTSPLA